MIADEQAIALARRWAAECGIDGCDAHHCQRCGRHTFGRCSSCDACDIADENRVECGVLSSIERDDLFGWLRQRADDYREGALAVGYDADPPRDELAEWIGLDLYEPFESDRDLTTALLDAAQAEATR